MKNNNPFELFGSYMGAIIFLVGYIIYFKSFTPNFYCAHKFLNPFETLVDCGMFLKPFSMLVGIIILGFLIGWLIHKLILQRSKK